MWREVGRPDIVYETQMKGKDCPPNEKWGLIQNPNPRQQMFKCKLLNDWVCLYMKLKSYSERQWVQRLPNWYWCIFILNNVRSVKIQELQYQWLILNDQYFNVSMTPSGSKNTKNTKTRQNSVLQLPYRHQIDSNPLQMLGLSSQQCTLSVLLLLFWVIFIFKRITGIPQNARY